ncbi:MAG: hypothetical protein R3B90_08715 [Planctomycetaceae bacterium]
MFRIYDRLGVIACQAEQAGNGAAEPAVSDMMANNGSNASR